MRQLKRTVKIGNITIGGTNPIAVQTMLNVPVKDIAGNVEQAKRVAKAGCQIVRVTVPTPADAAVVSAIKEAGDIPVVAGIHFGYRAALAAIDAGADKIRINPGNIGDDDRVKAVADACNAKNIPIRIGVNGGSLEKDLRAKYGGVTAEALVESAMGHVKLLNRYDFDDICISVKCSDVPLTMRAYTLLSQQTDYPLHLGVTEAGNGIEIRSQVFTGFSRYPRCGEIVCGVWPRVVSIGHLLASDIQAGSTRGSGEVEFPKVGTIAASEKFYQPCAFVMYEGLASYIEAGSEADSGAKIYPMCSPALRCSGTTYMTEGGEADAENTHSGRH